MEKTYEDLVLAYLQTHGHISDLTARDAIGTTRVSEYIRRLRVKGYDITTVWKSSKNRYGRKTRYGVYYYGAKEQAQG